MGGCCVLQEHQKQVASHEKALIEEKTKVVKFGSQVWQEICSCTRRHIACQPGVLRFGVLQSADHIAKLEQQVSELHQTVQEFKTSNASLLEKTQELEACVSVVSSFL